MTPDAARVINRARRSFGVSMAVLLVGLIAVVGALVYRATRDSGTLPVAPDLYALESVSLPTGATLISATASGGQVTLSYRLGEAVEVLVVSGETGDTLARFAVTND